MSNPSVYGSWDGAVAMTSCYNDDTEDTDLYIIYGFQLWKVDRHTGRSGSLSGPIFASADSMACTYKSNEGNFLNIIDNQTLYEWPLATRGVKRQLGAAGTWTGPNLMVYWGDLWVLENKGVWGVSNLDGSYQKVGSGMLWDSATSISHAMGYSDWIIQNSRLYEVDPGTGTRTQVGGAWWPGPTLMVGPFYSDG